MVASDALNSVHRVDRQLSVYRETSEVSRLNNAAAAAPQVISAELAWLLRVCWDLHQSTAGAFDPAVQSVIQLWSGCRSAGRIPDSSEVAAALACCGLDKLEFEKSADDESLLEQPGALRVSYKLAGVGLNFGAIGKGWGIDRAMDILRDAGLNDCLLHGGYSSLYACGEHAGQGGWPVDLKNPLFTDKAYLTLLLRDQALATSGSNVQFFRSGGKRYGHILDPRTGWPAEQLLSVSVLAPTAAEADALSTAFYVMGLEKSREYCHTHPSIGAILTPPPSRGRTLAPVLCNIPPDRVFIVSDDVHADSDGG
ncbi:MAG: FAD:protein FMN transferase [Planctomycetaceae bacterium]